MIGNIDAAIEFHVAHPPPTTPLSSHGLKTATKPGSDSHSVSPSKQLYEYIYNVYPHHPTCLLDIKKTDFSPPWHDQ